MTQANTERVQMKGRAPGYALLYVLVVVLFAFVPAAFYRFAPEPMVSPLVSFAASQIYRHTVREADYLASLRAGEFGCRTMFLRRPEVFFTGDSHNYAAWSFPDAGRNVPGRIGGCMMGGFYLESFVALLDAMRLNPPPRHVVFGSSPRMFWIAPDKDEQVRANIKALDAVVFNRRSLQGAWKESQSLPNSAETFAAALGAERGRIDALSEPALAELLSASRESLLTLRLWTARLREPPMTMGATAQLVRTICVKIRELGSSLTLIHIPESPFLEALYPASLWDDYIAKLNLFRECAADVIVERTKHYGLGNRHFANREFVRTLDYGVYARKEPLTDAHTFDPDHLNRLGSVVFTEAALARLKLK